MKICYVIASVALLSFVAAANFDEGVRWVFEDAPAGKVPGGWSVAQTDKGADSVWKVIEDTAAKSGTQVLAQLGAYGPAPGTLPAGGDECSSGCREYQSHRIPY